MVPRATNIISTPSPLPSLPSKTITTMEDRQPPNDNAQHPTQPHLARPKPTRPDNTRSSTDPSPSPSLLLQGYCKDKDNNKDWARPNSSHRNRSPYSRSHLRSRSSGAVAGAPLMTRAHSMPSPYTPRPFDSASSSGSASPTSGAGLGSGRTLPVRARSPFTAAGSGVGEGGMGGVGAGIESIQEDSELDFRPRGQQSQVLQPTALHAARVPSAGGRRRPASPLYSLPESQQQSMPQQAPTSAPAIGIQDFNTPNYAPSPSPAPHSCSGSASGSPSLGPQKEKYNETYPPPLQHSLNHHSSASSMASLNSFSSAQSANSFSSINTPYSHPSTPTSARSRSPSISSLDTIEDEPEMEAIEKLKEAADAEDGEVRRSSLDSGPRVAQGFGFTRGRSERKRWSVCGGERRGDLDLETIWED